MTKRLTPMFEDPGESARLRELLETGRSARVADYDFEQGLRRHLSQIEAGAPVPQWAQSFGAGGSAAAGGALSHSLWLWISVPLLSVSAITAVLWSSGEGDAPAVAPVAIPLAAAAPEVVAERERPAAPAEQALAAAEERQRHAPASIEPARSAPRSRATNPRPVRHAAVVARTATPALSGAQRTTLPASTPASRRADIASAEPTTARAAARNAAADERLQAPTAPEEPQPAAASEPVRPEPTRLDDTRLEREMGMLAMTQRVLFADPARALKLARQGEAEFEGSMFTQERQQLLLLALVKLGRLDEAKRLARPYLARYPNGPFSDRVRRSLASGRVDR